MNFKVNVYISVKKILGKNFVRIVLYLWVILQYLFMSSISLRKIWYGFIVFFMKLTLKYLKSFIAIITRIFLILTYFIKDNVYPDL